MLVQFWGVSVSRRWRDTKHPKIAPTAALSRPFSRPFASPSLCALCDSVVNQNRLELQTLDAVFQSLDVEIDQQARPDAGQFHVGQELCLVNPVELVDGFQL